jgi:transposase
VTELPDLSLLSHAEKDALIRALWEALQASERGNAELMVRLSAAERRIAELEARLGEPPKRPDNSSLPPSRGQKPNRPETASRKGPRKGSLGREGGDRLLAEDPDQTVIAKPAHCQHCRAALSEADHHLAQRYDKIDLPPIKPIVPSAAIPRAAHVEPLAAPPASNAMPALPSAAIPPA